MAVTACGGPRPGDEITSEQVGGRWCTIVFGAILPPTSGDPIGGAASRFGYEAAREALNSAGGVAVGAHRCLIEIRYAEPGGEMSEQVDHFARHGIDFLISADTDAAAAYSEPHGIPMLGGGRSGLGLSRDRADRLCTDPGEGAAGADHDGSAKAACAAAVLQLGLFQQAIEAAGHLDRDVVRRELLALGTVQDERRD